MSYPVGKPRPRRHRKLINATAVLMLLGTLALLGMPTAYADEPTGWPTAAWPTSCAGSAQYCVESAMVTPAGGSPTAIGPGVGLTLSVAKATGNATSFDWAVTGWDSVAAAYQTGVVTLVVRVGQFAPRYTVATAKGLKVSRVTSGGNTTLTITGSPVHVDWVSAGTYKDTCNAGTDCGTADLMADAGGTGYRFSGNTTDLDNDATLAGLDGAYVATDAQARPALPGIGTDENTLDLPILGNPHLDVTGKPVRGSFNAWLPPAFFSTVLHKTPTEAKATGFDVVTDGVGGQVAVPVTATLDSGGVALDVPDLGYSMRSAQVFNRASTAASNATLPGTPRSVELSAGTDYLTVQWDAPTSTGGLELNGYTARAFTTPTGGAVKASCTSGSATTCTIGGLTVNTTYYIAVSASNALGEGVSTSPRIPGAPSKLPSAPQSVNLTPGDKSLAVSWSDPISPGLTTITGYTAKAYTTATGSTVAATCDGKPDEMACTLSKLTNGTTYYVAVTATNGDGTGPSNKPRVSGVPNKEIVLPDLATDVVAVPGDKAVTVSWTPVDNFGSGTFSSYTATASPGSATCSASTAANCIITGLTNGTAYTVTVTTTTTDGTSQPSTASASVTPGAPALPTSVPHGDAALDSSAGGTFTTDSRTSTLTGTGFAPNTPILVGIYSTPTTLAAATTDAAGGVTVDVTIPDDFSGNHTLVMTGAAVGGGTRTLTLAVTVTDSLSSGGSTTLPLTGENVQGIATTGAALLLAGIVPLMVLRRRPVLLAVPASRVEAYRGRHRRED